MVTRVRRVRRGRTSECGALPAHPTLLCSHRTIFRHHFSSPSFVTLSRHLFALTLAALLSFAASCALAVEPSGPNSLFTLNMGDLKAELGDARAEGKRAVMLFFEQEGCPGCRHMKENVFNRTEVQKYYAQNFVSLALDIHSSVSVKDFSGRDFTEKTYSQSLKVKGTPTFIFYDLTGAEIVRILGPLQTSQEFLLLGQFVTSGAYKKATFAQYKAAAQH